MRAYCQIREVNKMGDIKRHGPFIIATLFLIFGPDISFADNYLDINKERSAGPITHKITGFRHDPCNTCGMDHREI